MCIQNCIASSYSLIALVLGVASLAQPRFSPGANHAAGGLANHGHGARPYRRPHRRADPRRNVTIATAAGEPVATAKADASGHYEVNGLAPGSYIIRATFAGFAAFVSPSFSLPPARPSTLTSPWPWRWSSRA